MSEDRSLYEARGFRGAVSRTREGSTPPWPTPQTPPASAPNIVVIYMDDMGYSDPGCFGSEIETPNIDALASEGLRFNHFTTHPMCTPARAALLTACNAHSVGSGWLANNHAGFPGYTGEIPLDVATFPEVLRAAGYVTGMVGKWHNTPGPKSLPSASKSSWPTQRGFDYFYGFMEGETSYFFPARLMLGNALLPIDAYPPGYYATDDWTDKAIQFIRDLRCTVPRRPFFLYLSHNAVHSPFQAKDGDRRKYQGRYDEGWTTIREARYRRQLELGVIPAGARLATSDPAVPAWESLDPRDRQLFVRHMETYAGMLDCVDQNVGRLVAYLKQMGEYENTLVVFTSDNGGSHAGPRGATFCSRKMSDLPEVPIEVERERLHLIGGPRSNALYNTGWAQASNCPFPTYKTYTGGGGRRVSFLLSWPRAIRDAGAVRTQFVHVTDVMPTLLDLAGISIPDGLDGASFAAALSDPQAAPPRNDQYYECWSNRAYYRQGWLARSLQTRGHPIDLDNWTLHDLREDFSESEDLGPQQPERLSALVDAFDRAAWTNLVYPLDNRTASQKYMESQADLAQAPISFYPGGQTIHRVAVVPLIADRSFRIRARVVTRSHDEGVLWSIGEGIAGIVLFIEGGQLRCVYNGYGEQSELPPIPPMIGEHEIALDYEALGERRGRGRLVVDEVAATGWHSLSPTLMWGIQEGLDVGLDRRAPVCWELFERRGTFPFSGEIHSVVIEPGALARAFTGKTS